LAPFVGKTVLLKICRLDNDIPLGNGLATPYAS
jgi:hypothetical protein